MYPDLSYIVHALIGIGPDNALSIVKTFGLLLILAFLASAFVFRLELIRKEKEGLIKPSQEEIVEGKKATPAEIAINALIGFLLGFKLLYITGHFAEFQSDTAGGILSGKGSVIGGILGAVLLGDWKWWDSNRRALPKPRKKTVLVHPYERVGDITIVAAVSGIIGAKLAALFESTENIQAFLADPMGQLLSGSGLAIYGGLILAFITVYLYVRKKGIKPIHVMDAVAPALITGYGVGRIGCQLSGDGDWGVVNLADPPSWWFLPDSFWATTYPHNVLHDGIPIEGCTWEYCNQLAQPVYPTPIYEVFMSLVIFAILWSLRKRIKVPGVLFFVYAILIAVERLLIEQIRVNPDISMFGMKATQAEFISGALLLLGTVAIGILVYRHQSIGTHPLEKTD